MSSLKQVDVIVIGAGIAGLTSAYELQNLTNQSTEVILLEAKDRIGGRTYGKSIPCASGEEEWDLGGQWVSSTQVYVTKLLKEFNIETYPQYTKGIKKLYKEGSGVQNYKGLIPSLNVLELLDVNHVLSVIDSMALQIPVGAPLDCHNAMKWDGETLKSFADATCKFSASRDVLSAVSRVVLGIEPSQVSLFYFLYYCTLSGGITMLLDTKEGAAQQFCVKGTASKLAYKLQEKIGADKVYCEDAVRSVTQCSDASVLVKTLQGREYQAKFVICAIPPHLVNQIHFEPALPTNRVQLGSRMPMGNMIKCLITYRTAFWRMKGVSAESVSLFGRPGTGPIEATFDATSCRGNPAIVAFMGGEHAIYWSQKTQNERKEAVITSLVSLFGKEAETELIHYEDKDWSKEPYTGGCPVSVMQPGCLVYFDHALREPFGRVHWAGTETARKWSGYIDGAVESGLRAAKEIAGRLNSQADTSESGLETPSSIFPVAGHENLSDGGKKNALRKHFPKFVFVCAVGGIGYCLYKKYRNN